uniref:RBR-type E3 ubiquitin transferase n=1 Tax=Scophthalmus maximus TaxID=52904 RepID=A0A8D3A8K0_SCOMX
MLTTTPGSAEPQLACFVLFWLWELCKRGSDRQRAVRERDARQMGRAKPGMDDDGPIADACKMPSFIGSFEEGRLKCSRNLPTETSLADGKVERPLGDLSRRVARSNSRLSLDGGERESGDKDAEGNNNNNCNGGGGERRRRASAVEILRRNFGVAKSPSLRLSHTSGRMQRGAERENHPGGGDGVGGHGSECGDRTKSHRGTGDAATRNEPTSGELTSADAPAVQCHHIRDIRSGDSCGVKEHVYCAVYCIADDSQREDVGAAHRRDETDAPGAPLADSDSEREAGSSPEPPPYTLDDLVDPFADMAPHQPYRKEQAGAESAVQSCRVCLEDKTIALLPCCRKAVCDECLKLYVSSQVRVAKPYISCPIPECSGYLEEGVVISHLANEDVAKYRYFLELNQLDSSTKPCPQCSQFTSLKNHGSNHSEHKYKIQCETCQFVWCFKCHAPWHNGLKCRDYRKGDKLLRTWASVIEHGQRNAQKCPQCKIHIQRTEGCDHMTCTQCNTNFCYRCGERYRHLRYESNPFFLHSLQLPFSPPAALVFCSRFFGDHTSNLSIFGCKYRYLPDKPHLRRLIRGSVCGMLVYVCVCVCVGWGGDNPEVFRQ